MTSQQFLHEVGVLLLGASGAYAIQQAPIEASFKRIASAAVAVITGVLMARIAGVF